MPSYEDCMLCGVNLGRSYKKPIMCDPCEITSRMEDAHENHLDEINHLIYKLCDKLNIKIPKTKQRNTEFMLSQCYKHICNIEKTKPDDTNTDFLLSYRYKYDTDSGSHWDHRMKVVSNLADLNKALSEIRALNATKTYPAPYVNIRVFRLKEERLLISDALEAAEADGGDCEGEMIILENQKQL